MSQLEKGALFVHDVVSNLCTLVQISVAFGVYSMKLDEPIKNVLNTFLQK